MLDFTSRLKPPGYSRFSGGSGAGAEGRRCFRSRPILAGAVILEDNITVLDDNGSLVLKKYKISSSYFLEYVKAV